MKLTEQEAAALYRRMTARTDRSGCLGEELLIRAAANTLTPSEREEVSSHLAQCSDCAREYQIARSLRSLPEERWSAARWIAVAATVLLAVSLAAVVWLVRTNEQLRDATRPIAPVTVEVPKPQVGVPIVDLDSDLVRGGAEAVPRIVVPPTTDVFTLILHLPAPVERTPVDVEIAGVWRGAIAVPPGSNSITVALHRRMVPAGSHTLRVNGAAFRFDVVYP